MMCGTEKDWEIVLTTIKCPNIICEDQFGEVHQAMWYGTFVAIKVLKTSFAITVRKDELEIRVAKDITYLYSMNQSLVGVDKGWLKIGAGASQKQFDYRVKEKTDLKQVKASSFWQLCSPHNNSSSSTSDVP